MNRRVLGHVSTWWSSFVDVAWITLLCDCSVGLWKTTEKKYVPNFQQYYGRCWSLGGEDSKWTFRYNQQTELLRSSLGSNVVKTCHTTLRVSLCFFKSCIHSLHFIAKQKVKAVPFATRKCPSCNNTVSHKFVSILIFHKKWKPTAVKLYDLHIWLSMTFLSLWYSVLKMCRNYLYFRQKGQFVWVLV